MGIPPRAKAAGSPARKLMKYVFTLLFILVCITPTLSDAADNSDIHENAGTRAMTFLKIGIGAKAIGMGESHVAAADDLYASYWNPAGLVKLQKPQLALMHNERFADINYEHIGVAFPIGEKNSVGVSVNYQSYGEMQGRDQEGNETELFNAYDLAMVLSYARGFGDSLAVGVNAKLLREQIADENGSGFAFDFGGMYTMPDLPLSFGINAQHVGPRIKYVEEAFLLPFTLRIGAAYRLWHESFLVTMDFIRPTDNHNSFGVGLGYTILNILQLRSGYIYKLGGNDLGAMSGLRAGFGLTLRRFQIDYALVPYGALGLTNRFSLIASF